MSPLSHILKAIFFLLTPIAFPKSAITKSERRKKACPNLSTTENGNIGIGHLSLSHSLSLSLTLAHTSTPIPNC